MIRVTLMDFQRDMVSARIISLKEVFMVAV